MKYRDLRDFIEQLERQGELKRIDAEVDHLMAGLLQPVGDGPLERKASVICRECHAHLRTVASVQSEIPSTLHSCLSGCAVAGVGYRLR